MRYFGLFWQRYEQWLDGQTMYRVVRTALLVLVGCAIFLGLFDFIPYSSFEQIRSLLIVVGISLLVHESIRLVTKIPSHRESTVITALIVYFLITPASSFSDLQYIALAAVLSTVAKYIFVWKRQHVANPAAVGVVLLSATGYYEVTWWIGTPELFIPLVLVGAMVVQKVRKWTPVVAFLITSLLVFLYEEWKFFNSFDNWSVFFLSYPALFLAFFMLTEPFSMPPTKRLQCMYGVLVGFFAHTTWFMSYIKMSPELALVIGNLLFAPTTLRQKLIMRLRAVRVVATDTYEWVFEKPAHMHFVAGQYMEWMIPHTPADNRGTRRYFTIAASPLEKEVRFAARIPQSASSYKKLFEH
jgi:glycine betaine catabolism B